MGPAGLVATLGCLVAAAGYAAVRRRRHPASTAATLATSPASTAATLATSRVSAAEPAYR